MTINELKNYYSLAVGITAINGLGYLSDELINFTKDDEEGLGIFSYGEDNEYFIKPRIIKILKRALDTALANDSMETAVILDNIVKKLQEDK